MSPDGHPRRSSSTSTAAWLLSKVRGNSGGSVTEELRSGVVEACSDPEWHHTMLLDSLAAATARGATAVLVRTRMTVYYSTSYIHIIYLVYRQLTLN